MTLSDVQAYDEARLALAEGRDELIPEPFASRLMDGVEHPLTVFRELRGLTPAELACASGMDQAQIQDIEAGRATGPPRTVAVLAQALGIDVSDLTA